MVSDEQAAVAKVNAELKARGVSIGIQVLLRENVRGYLRYVGEERLEPRASSRPEGGGDVGTVR